MRAQIMDKLLEDAISRLKSLPLDRQHEAAARLLDFLEEDGERAHLTPEQMEEIERRLSDPEPFASDDEVRATYDRLTK
jgi:hypothetical protein